ncbi:potassium-transporting ATPase subunit KdpA [Niveispirillum sp. KHB5.9]|uniref:potassium-transporting ATPase subunit KdpA n=1 Tax=Niveispirillum sp. KHB5.9 TaxID=3400269 RepID=UPI003A83C248
MTLIGWIQIALYCAIIIAVTRPLGGFMTHLFTGRRTLLSPVLRPVEVCFYKLAGVDERAGQHWLTYAVSMLLFNLAGAALLYAILRVQDVLPLNPQGLPALPAELAFNTAISFVTNTNWQSYGGETTMSYLSQMVGLTVQNFLSAATGIALALALVRGFAGRSAKTIGNFWVDMTRATLYLLLPLSILATVFFIWQGVPQNFDAYTVATTVEGAQQTIAQGPVASQLAIKMLGTNGGGFFNVNSAHPFENPTALSNFVQMLLIFTIGAGLTNLFGRMVGNEKQGWAILGAMGVLFIAGVGVTYWAEAGGNPLFAGFHVDQTLGNFEGKEVRFGTAMSALFAVITTAASCGAVNAMHDSFMPLGGMVPMINMLLGEIIVGGVGAGLYGMLLMAIIAMFVAGLMVGRTPEYVGKKLEAREIKLVVLSILAMPAMILILTAVSVAIPQGTAGIQDAGPHGFSEVFYAFTSAAANNGSAFGGLTANSVWYTVSLGIAMFVGRFFIIVPMLAAAGSLAAKRPVPVSAGTFPTTGPLFVGLLVGVILIVGGLTYFPALSLGPVVEHLMLVASVIP